MNHPALELSDVDTDALTLHADSAGIWVTCTSGETEVTVGPLPGKRLADWIAAVAAPAALAAPTVLAAPPVPA
ncbi:hypothetical protein NLU66_07210 [Brachybacterium sp. NBEC-018]|uniref:hypothetical protein n=1 Tax=Brachybacterium sp. NBEC-018 TaxID=2996004 RepID=UPI0021752583|nr:hypothetical protein [Brachybacterium sp. NBEC-018]UVY85369.1 hypothetical protein NLU66_07210 [Brachybacterium sp. NBEC-018]